MLSSRIQRLSAVGLLSLTLIGAATQAFAIRNRYTNEQNEGFAALFFEAFGRPGFGEDQPFGPPHRRALYDGADRRYDDRDAPPAY